jgi:hypothetical protein
VFAVVVLAVLGTSLLRLGLGSRVTAIRNADEISARCAADAGLTKAVFAMNRTLQAKSWTSASLPRETNQILPNCDATFSYKIVANSLNPKKGQHSLTSEGRSGQARKTINATVGLKSLFDSAILVKDRISLMPNTLVDGYNSLDPNDTDIDLRIGTVSTLADRIPLGPGTVVDGDVFVGVDGDPQAVIGAGGTILGDKYALTQEPPFPVITPPALANVGTDLSAKGATISVGPAQSGTYSGISLSKAGGSQGILEVVGGAVVLHISGNIDLGQGCELVIRPGASLSLYVDGDIDADNSVGFNNEAGNIKAFAIYATGTGDQSFALKAKSSVFGVVYAPDVDIQIYPGSEMHGAIVGNSVQFKSGGNFYYDAALREVDLDDEGVRFVVKRWSE